MRWISINSYTLPLPFTFLPFFVSVAGGEDDLEYYVRECGDILGISSKMAVNKRSAKDVLQYVFQHVVECKKLNQASLSDNTLNLTYH